MSEDIKQILSDYRMWMKSGDQGEASISIEDIDGEETFGAALDEILRLEATVERLREALGCFISSNLVEDVVRGNDHPFVRESKT